LRFTNRKQAHEFYQDIFRDAERDKCVSQVMAKLGLDDLFFLMVFLLNRQDVDRDWLFERCQEVQNSPNGHLDLWAREHYKSTIITFGLTIQDILYDPDLTIGIFSITRPNAKKFLEQIRRELTDNTLLKQLYPDVLWANPTREAPKWSLDEGIVLKRKVNPKEATVEAHGLVEGMPTGRHFKIRVYDDVIDEANVTNPDMIRKSTKAWELSLNLGSAQSTKRYEEIDIERYVGTRYHFNDPYAEMLRRKSAIPRIYPGTVDGTVDGDPVLWDKDFIVKKRRNMGPYVFGCQILQDPKADEVQGFKLEWLRHWRPKEGYFKKYILVDPASEKKKDSDFTVFIYVGLGVDKNYYIFDIIRDRLSLTERANVLFDWHLAYQPDGVGYERYGMQADIEHFQDRMTRQNYWFDITELKGNIPKNDRIRKLIPLFESGRIFLPHNMVKTDYLGASTDLIQSFINDEYLAFPVGVHDDMLDCLARICDPDMITGFTNPKRYRGVSDAGRIDQYIRGKTSRKPWEPPKSRKGGRYVEVEV